MNQTAALPMMPTPPALPAETPLQKAARESVGHGLHLIAVEIGGKGPLAKGWTSTRHASAAAAVDALASHRGNFGVTMSSDIVVIDVDCKNGVDGAGSLQAYVQSLDSELPATRRTDTPSGGHHLYFRLPPGVTLRNGTKFLPGVDIRTAGGQVLCEPSVVNGKPYVAVRDAAGDQLPIADMPFVLAIAFAGTQHHGAPAAPRPPQVSPIEIDSALLGDLRAALAFHDPDNHDGWVTVGMALKSLGEPGYALWEEWSATSSRYPGGDGLDRWNSFRPDHTGPASVFKKAQAAGWKNPGRKRAKSIASAFAGQVATPGTVAANAAVLGPMPMPPAPPVPAVPVADAFPLDPVLSEDALALMFVSLCGAQFRHTPGMGWMRNDGPNWTRDDELRRLSQVRKLLRQVGASTGNDRVRLRVESAKTAAAVISFAASDERIAVPAAAWDANPAVLNTPAGIVDLRTGQIRPHAGELHTQVTRVSPDSTGPRGAFDGFMRAVFMGDAAMVEFMQRLLGYFATGDRREQKLS